MDTDKNSNKQVTNNNMSNLFVYFIKTRFYTEK